MRNFVTRTLLAFTLCATAGVAALAGETTTKEVTFPEDVTVEGKLFKKGTYKMKYDSESGDLTIVNGKNSVTTKAHVAKRDGKALHTVVGSVTRGDSRVLQSITFRGEGQSFVIGDAQQAKAGQ
ncbi:MAG TPA: hypothetical protein VEQ42_11270 [Pyrinomonadaceae bacterium]|nr:hypothetical protein [Pyrinomonadaceae bacterium]